MMDALHFLRPLWLFGLPLTLLVWWFIRRRAADDAARGMQAIAEHLRDALTVNQSANSGYRAVDGIAVVLVLLSIAAAGPTTGKQSAPWFQETAPLVIAIEVSDSMLATDVAPTRLDRARFKVLDLLERRTGARTAIIAYAGSAHIVLPATTDVGVIKPFLEGLAPAVMPVAGSNARTVLPLARRLLQEDVGSGTLLFVNDGFDEADVSALSAFNADPSSPAITALVVGTESGSSSIAGDNYVDEALLSRVSRESGIDIVRMSNGDNDLRALLRSIESSLVNAGDPDAEWKDLGWWFLWPVLLLSLAWFRRGWTMRW